jgi:alanine racemase
LDNLKVFQDLYKNQLIAPVLKANAYGHGLVELACILDEKSFSFIVVDSYFEAKMLRARGIKTALVIIGYVFPDIILNNKLPKISFTITAIETLEEISRRVKKDISLHLKINTGMHRQGISQETIGHALDIFKLNRKLHLQGVCSHLGDADNPESQITQRQINDWNTIVKKIKSEIQDVPFFHITATSGTAYSDKIDANVNRLGLGMFGIDEYPERSLNLKPTLEIQTIITSIRKLKKGERVGYSATFIAPRDMIIATIPMGYSEGIERRLSNKGFMLVDKIKCPIIGRVSMNITSIDITNVSRVKAGDKVIAISSNSSDPNSIVNIAKTCETISHDILVRIPQHLRRVIV